MQKLIGQRENRLAVALSDFFWNIAIAAIMIAFWRVLTRPDENEEPAWLSGN